MWTSSLTGTRKPLCGSKLFSAFLLAYSFFSASSLFGQTPSSQVQPTTPSDQYSKMTREELLKQIAEKDKLLNEWLTWQEEVKISQAEQEQAHKEQLASRDKLITDYRITLAATEQERDQYKAEIDQQAVMGWLERLLWGLGGTGLGFTAGHFTK